MLTFEEYAAVKNKYRNDPWSMYLWASDQIRLASFGYELGPNEVRMKCHRIREWMNLEREDAHYRIKALGWKGNLDDERFNAYYTSSERFEE